MNEIYYGYLSKAIYGNYPYEINYAEAAAWATLSRWRDCDVLIIHNFDCFYYFGDPNSPYHYGPPVFDAPRGITKYLVSGKWAQ